MSLPAFARQDSLRWGLAFAFAAAAHGAVAVAVLTNWQTEDMAAGMPVVIELDMMSASPDSASSESVPGPEQTQADANPDSNTNDETEPEKTEPQPEPETAETPPETEQAAVEPPTPDPVEVPDTVPAKPAPKPRPDIKASEVKKPEPKRETKKPERKPKRQQTAAATTAPSSAESVASIPASPTFGHGARDARSSWHSRIRAHLLRHMRYPAAARAHGETGVAQFSFTLDRRGHVISSRLIASSGHASLDRETAALIQRAQPLPPPPPELAGARFSFSQPFRYNFR
ncbi:energy transducer TonB [Blastochloris sulfoviridis]|uniref:Energy transducer TonB n=1 Tax=Blastochloris sulfoviridis TaxID=50712 RepID=A0A5M6I1C3_9HYPH|nr:energy transducer TonB [Blastochloris sulfoviridis]KAA5601970.1 energy transducer TonB [Blastochloris sulfoviridis]